MSRSLHAQPVNDALAKYEHQCREGADWKARARAGETLANNVRKLLHADDVARIRQNDVLREAAECLELAVSVDTLSDQEMERVDEVLATIQRELGAT